jgi:hypothetical protein
MGILTLDHKGWLLDIEYWFEKDEVGLRESVTWTVERVAQAGHPDDYPTDSEIMKAVVEAATL